MLNDAILIKHEFVKKNLNDSVKIRINEIWWMRRTRPASKYCYISNVKYLSPANMQEDVKFNWIYKY